LKKSLKLMIIFCLMSTIALSFTTYAAPKVTLRFSWWGTESRHKATLAAIELYMKKNPNVKIEAEYGGFDGYQQKLLVQLAGGEAPDVIQIDQGWLQDIMAQGNLLTDLNKYKSILKINEFNRNFLKQNCTVKGKLVGLPTGINSHTYIVNKNLLDKFGIKPDTNWDWDTLLQIGTRVHKQDSSCYLLVYDSNNIDLLRIYLTNKTGKQWINSDYTLGFTKSQLVEAFTYYRKLLDSGTLEPIADSAIFENKIEQDSRWIHGKVVMVSGWASTMDVFKRPEFDLTVMRPVIGKKAKSTGVGVRSSQVFSIYTKSKHPKEAAQFMNWLFTDPNSIVTLGMSRGVPPTEKASQLLADKNMVDKNISTAVNLGLKNAGLPDNAISTNNELLTIGKEVFLKVGYGNLSPEQAADELIKSLKAKLAELKAAKK
jgi:oligogalacturonide transport system substrate-binding protein